MKQIILIVLSFCFLNVYSQFDPYENKEIEYSFNDGLELFSNKSGVIFSAEYDSCIKFPGESYIVFEEIDNPKELKFQYQYAINSGQIIFTISIKKPGTESFSDLKRIVFDKNPVNTTNMFDQIVPVPFSEQVDIKFSISYPDNSVGQFFLDNVKIVLYSSNEVAEQKRMERYLIETKKLASSQVADVKVKDYNDKLMLIRSEYVANVNQLRTLAYRSNTLASLSKLIVFVNKRNQISNPNNYSVFRDKIEIIKQNCDPIQVNYVDHLVEEIEPKEFTEPMVDGGKKSGFSRVVQVLGDVGNILTGGAFKGLANSLQGIVSSVFSPNSIRSRVPELLTSISVKGKPIIQLNPEYSSENISNLTQQGLNIQKVFFDFFDILNKDRDDFTQLVSEFQYYSQNIDRLISTIDKTRLEFFQLVDYEMQEDYYLETFLDVDEKKVNELSEYVNQYFVSLQINDSTATKTIPTVFLRKIEQADQINKEIITILDEYKNHAADLRVLFGKVEQDLEKENPFGIWQEGQLISSQEDIFGDAFQSFNNLREEAKNDFTNLYTNLDKILR